ncbi:hypothetical protein [Alloalcanivorax gelatiniphagus]|uniref:DUF2065 domain-containing protein n=1 Tax=Alloalcanivorax gelatiniphagus TaxID=1194167 RepID=A0ABY2XJG5_9GAMM|nr:hypothetical protein [Alloalcanivorax gelatiniphagus]TMW12095.1 hypothetical protein FGS76_11380 [Alloalcanivorax gelatiniphagus]
MDFLNKVGEFLSDMTNAGMVFEAIGIFLVAKYGIPRNSDASPHDIVVISKTGEDLNAAMRMLKTFTRRERLGFTLMGLGIILMLLDRNL